jgi:hypothetical protein
MMGVFRILFPAMDRRRSTERFRDARVRDSVARSEQVLATHDRVVTEVAAIERMLARKDLKPDVRSEPCR